MTAETTHKILVLPFHIQTAQNHSFLTVVIADMLFSRLSAEDRTIIVGDQDTREGTVATAPISTPEAIILAHHKKMRTMSLWEASPSWAT